MAAPHPVDARFPQASANAGLYESFYLKLCHPSEPLGAWIRYTVHKPPGEEPTGSLWFTLFEPDGPSASKVTLPGPRAGSGEWIRVGESVLSAGRATGAAPSGRCQPVWDLRFSTAESPLFHLPRPRFYRTPVPRTKLLSAAPAASFDGTLTLDGREIRVEGWRGMAGHNWGAEHAERWIWLHGLDLDGAPAPSWIDVAIGRVRIGPLTTPWIANGALSLGGERHRLGGPGRRARVEERPDGCRFTLPGRVLSVRGEVGAGRQRFVGWVYADPDGGEHHTVNCSIADMRLEVERAEAPPLELSVTGSAAYELGMRERDHGMEIQPFPDG